MVYLNELRYLDAKPLEVRVPVPARLAGLEDNRRSQVEEESDYRGRPVLSAIRWVPDSPWLLISKIDRDEVFFPIRRLSILLGVLVGLVLFVAVGIVVLVIVRSRSTALELQLQSERRLKALAQRLALVTQYANEIIMIGNQHGDIQDVNEMALATYGYSVEELRRMNLADLRIPRERVLFASQLSMVENKQGSVYETVHVTKGGRVFPVEVNCRLVELDGSKALLTLVRDSTQRKQHEADLERLNHFYEALTQINQMLIRVESLDMLLQEACRIMVQHGRFWLVWIGRYDKDDETIFPVASGGEELSFLEGFTLSTADASTRELPTVIAVKTGRSSVCRDFSKLNVGIWRERLSRYKFTAAASFPIRHRQTIWGNLTVYSVDGGAFEERECGLMEETAADISYAMDVMADRAEHRQMETQLRESERRFRTLFETMSEIVALHELVYDSAGKPVDYRIIDCNSSFSAGMGIPRERALGALASKLYGTGQAPYLIEYARVALSGQALTFESYFEPLKRHFSISVASPGEGRFATVATDITVRKQTENELRESEQRFRATFEHAAAGIAHVDINGQFLRVNQRLCELLGHAREELLHSTIQDVTHPEDLSADLSQIRRLLGGEIETYSMEKRYIARNGGVVWAQLTCSLVQHPEGVPHYLIAVIQDIGLRKQAEAALKGSEERYRRLTRAVTDYVYTVRIENGHATETIHGEGCIAVTGYAPREFMQNPNLWIDMVMPEDRPLVVSQAAQILKNRGAGAVEHRIRRKDGRIRWVRNTTSPHLDSHGNFLSYDGLVQDITERKQAEIKLRETNLELQSINRIIAMSGASIDLEAVVQTMMDQALYVTRMEGAAVFLLEADNYLQLVGHRNASPAVVHEYHSFKHPASDCLCGNCPVDGKPFILGSPDQIAQHARHESQRDDPLHFHAAYPLLAQQRCIGVLCVFSRHQEKPQTASLHLMETISPSFALALQNALLHRETVRYGTQMESLVKGRTAELQAANAELESFSYSVSHDLRAPLRAINGVMQILLEDFGDGLSPDVRKHIGMVCGESQRMGRLIDDLLAFSRLGRQALHPVEMELGVLCAEVQDELAAREPRRVIEWSVEGLPKVSADPVFLRQVFVNILGNALKYTRKREVTRIGISGRVEGGEAIVSIADNGAGFDMKYVDKLFGVFQRLHSDSEFEGTGVGLALVQRILQRHGGRVWAESELGRGSVFHFALPVRQSGGGSP